MSDSHAATRRFLASLRKTQWLSPLDLARYQAPLLERVCRHAATQAPFYADRLRPLFARGDPSGGAFRPQAWAEIPVFDRAEAQAAGDRLHAAATPDAVGPATRMQTSGSTGRPLVFHRSALADIAGLAQSELIYETHGFDRSACLGWIHYVPETAGWTQRRQAGWNITDPRAELAELSKAAATADCVDWLRRERPRHLMTAPSMVEGLLRVLEDTRAPPLALDRILVTSEGSADDLGERVAAAFGAKLVDSYGTREVGVIAVTCPDAPPLGGARAPAKHLAAETALVEILRPDGSVAAPGETGRVVVTPFYAYATPFVRYDLGDLAVQGAPACACGRGLPLIEKVLGRSHALFRFADGTTRFPAGLKAVGRLVPMRQMQAVQTAIDRVEIRYVPQTQAAPPDYEAARSLVRQALHPDLEVTFTPMVEIPLGPGGKFEDLICLVPPSRPRRGLDEPR